MNPSPKSGVTIYHVEHGNITTIPVEVVIGSKKKVVSSDGRVFSYDSFGNILIEQEGEYNIIDKNDTEW